MYSVAKVIRSNPEDPKFLSTLALVYDEKSHTLANVMVLVENHELVGVVLAGCVEGPDLFEEVLALVHHHFMADQGEGQRLIYKEHFPNLMRVDDFIAEHIHANLPKHTARAVTEDVAAALRRCMPDRAKAKR